MTRPSFHNLTCALFDLDGTLVDSAPLHDLAFRHALEKERPDLLAAFDYRAVTGLTTRVGFRRLGLADGEITRCTTLKQAHYRALQDQLVEMPGAGLLLARLGARGIRVGIVSSASRTSAQKALAITGLARHVAALTAAEDAPQAKPSPAPFHLALEKLNADPARTIAVDDAPVGIQAAKAAGLVAVGVHNPQVQDIADIFFSDLHALAGELA